MEPGGDLERRDSINNLIERLTAELRPDGASGGQYSPFGPIGAAAPPGWHPPPPPPPQPRHELFGAEPRGAPYHGPGAGGGAQVYQADPVGAAGPELGTAQLSDHLAAHLAGFDAPLFDPRQPPPPQPPPPHSFLSSWFGGWWGSGAEEPTPGGHERAAPPPPPTPAPAPAAAEPPTPPQQQPEPAPACPPAPAAPVSAASPPTQAAPPPPAATPATPPPAQPAQPAQPARPSYSAVLAKPAPAPGAAPRPAAAKKPAESDAAPAGGGGGGSRRGTRGQGRRRRASDAEPRPAREEARGAAGDGAQVAPAQPRTARAQTEQGEQAKKGKNKKVTRTASLEERPAPGGRRETLNNNPDRAQPPAQRRPLNYNNNLGSSSTLGPAQTHLLADPPAPAAGDAKKVDVNVGKQKNCGKTSNEIKKVDNALSKPDNKTLSQSRGGPQPLNLLTPGAVKSERVAKELAFRPRPGRARGRRAADDEPGDRLRRLRAQLSPGLALLRALAAWLLNLVLDVVLLSGEILWRKAAEAARGGRDVALRWAAALRAAASQRAAAVRAWLARPPPATARTRGLKENIPLPTTGDEAMTRLLAGKNSDPYSILGVTHDCSDADIRKYYRRQALLVHPDKSRCPGAEEAFKILQRAFQLIGAPEKREAFDNQVREKDEVNEAFRQYMDEMMTRLREKIAETQNTLRCNKCNQRHRRTRVERPCYAARDCAQCKIRHAAREGDIWAESSWLGVIWRYYACMDGGVFDISEWAACQAASLKHLQANHHTVQYRIISGAKRHKQTADEPSDRDLEDILNNLCNGSLGGEQPQGRRRTSRRRGH